MASPTPEQLNDLVLDRQVELSKLDRLVAGLKRFRRWLAAACPG